MKNKYLILSLIVLAGLLAFCIVLYDRQGDPMLSVSSDVVESDHSPVHLDSEQHVHNNSDGLHNHNYEDIAELVNEETKDLEARHLLGGPEEYRNLKLMATEDRSLKYGAVVEPRKGYETLFSLIEVTSKDIADYARDTSITVIEQEMGQTSSKHAEVKIGDPTVSKIHIGEMLKVGQLPLKLYDGVLAPGLEVLLEKRLLMSFYEKNNLMPIDKDISFFTETTQQGILVVVKTRTRGSYHEYIEGSVGEKELDRIIQQKIEGIRRELGAKAFVNQAKTILTPADIREYFPREGVVDEREIIRFLKDRANIVKRVPDEVRDDLKIR